MGVDGLYQRKKEIVINSSWYYLLDRQEGVGSMINEFKEEEKRKRD